MVETSRQGCDLATDRHAQQDLQSAERVESINWKDSELRDRQPVNLTIGASRSS